MATIKIEVIRKMVNDTIEAMEECRDNVHVSKTKEAAIQLRKDILEYVMQRLYLIERYTRLGI